MKMLIIHSVDSITLRFQTNINNIYKTKLSNIFSIWMWLFIRYYVALSSWWSSMAAGSFSCTICIIKRFLSDENIIFKNLEIHTLSAHKNLMSSRLVMIWEIRLTQMIYTFRSAVLQLIPTVHWMLPQTGLLVPLSNTTVPQYGCPGRSVQVVI